MVKKKTKRKAYQRLVNEDCPLCGKSLSVWVMHATKEEFLGCSRFPACKYTVKKSDIDFARQELDVPIDWFRDKDKELYGVFLKCQSSKEKLYLLGAIFYLNTDNFQSNRVMYRGRPYYGLVFNRVYGCLKEGGSSPTSLAIVPQVEFGEKYHHDFGIFFSDEKYPTEDNWWLGLGVEVDFHPKHELIPCIDKYRDSLVNYKVLRLKEADEPKNWFTHVEHIYNYYADNGFQIMKEAKQ